MTHAAAAPALRSDGGLVAAPDALRLLPAEWLQSAGAVPYAVSNDRIDVAYAGIGPELLAREVQVRTGRAARVRWAPPDEIEAALAAAFWPDDAPALLRAQALAWLDALGAGGGTSARAVASGAWLDALSLATGRPIARPEAWREDPALRLLLTARTARERRAVPLALVDGALVLAVDGGTPAEPADWHAAAQAAVEETGLPVRVALVERETIDRLIAARYPSLVAPRCSSPIGRRRRSVDWAASSSARCAPPV